MGGVPDSTTCSGQLDLSAAIGAAGWQAEGFDPVEVLHFYESGVIDLEEATRWRDIGASTADVFFARLAGCTVERFPAWRSDVEASGVRMWMVPRIRNQISDRIGGDVAVRLLAAFACPRWTARTLETLRSETVNTLIAETPPGAIRPAVVMFEELSRERGGPESPATFNALLCMFIT